MDQISEKYKKYIELLNDITDSDINTTIKATDPIEFFDKLEDGMDKADELYNMVNTSHFYIDTVHDKSTTFGDELTLKLKALQKISYELKSFIKSSLTDIIHEYMEGKNKPEIVGMVIDKEYNNIFVIEMLKIIHKTSDIPIKVQINKYITKLKDDILGTTHLDTYESYDAIQSILINAGFVPASDFMSEKEIIETIEKEKKRIDYTGSEDGLLTDEIIGGGKSDPSIVKKLQSNKISFMYLKRTIGTPVEYNIDAYISAKYVSDNNMETKNGEGLTSNFIKRFNTPRFLDKAKSWDGSGQVYANLDENKSHSFIVETLDGETYRFLNISKYYISVNTNIIIHLQKGLGTRHDDYNAIHENQIMANAFNISGVSVMKQFDNAGLTFNEDDFISALKNEPRKQSLAKKVYAGIDSYVNKRGLIDLKKHADSALTVWSRTPDVISRYGKIIGDKSIEDKNRAMRRTGVFKIPYRSARDFYNEAFI